MAKRKVFAWSPLRRLMRKQGAHIVARSAGDILIADLESTALKLTQRALKFANHAKRKKISKEDMRLAIKYT
jgi:histone H3/H4